ncbi:MAG: hypothetical protein FJ387_15135 [Verrucomicrobia bacterium]|nr:hypothetical protein [Verrucomicrobiota bacterium]
MTQTLERRVEELEKKVAELGGQPVHPIRKKDPWRTFGIFRSDADFEAAAKLGRDYRRQQTYDKELAGP